MKTCSQALFAVVAGGLFLGFAGSALAGGLPISSGTGFSLACENGSDYRLRPRTVSVGGDLVAGDLFLRPRHAVHVRLVPMGVGYRYSGKGVWFDGTRGEAILYLQKNRPLACQVVQG